MKRIKEFAEWRDGRSEIPTAVQANNENQGNSEAYDESNGSHIMSFYAFAKYCCMLECLVVLCNLIIERFKALIDPNPDRAPHTA